MAGMGLPPKSAEQRRRRNKSLQLTVLPAGGRQGKPPAWPLSKMQAGELAAWRQVWSTPQAVEWERLGWHRVVARYVRVLVESEQPEAVSATRAECRQMEDRLGLSPMAMLRLRWAIEEREDQAPQLAPVAQLPDRWRNTAAG